MFSLYEFINLSKRTLTENHAIHHPAIKIKTFHETKKQKVLLTGPFKILALPKHGGKCLIYFKICPVDKKEDICPPKKMIDL